VRRWLYHRLCRALTLSFSIALAVAKRIGGPPRSPSPGKGYDILLTGRFFSENWALSHLAPLAASQWCSRLTVVSTFPLSPMPKVAVLYPPRWLVALVGATPARLLAFAMAAFRKRPHVIGGFHITFNAVLAIFLASLTGARSLYFCVGGPAEVLDGGIWREGGAFKKMETPDPLVESRFIRAADRCDLIITMGTRAVQFFRQKGVTRPAHVLSGGIDSERFRPTGAPRPYDLILVGRLEEVKRIDLFLDAVAGVAVALPNVRAAVVGNGVLLAPLEEQARRLGISQCVQFVGFQPCVSDWLKQARVFVLTSRTEGLSLALMEGMMCGLPAVVPNVGDLGDLVENGVNGCLIDERTPEAFAEPLISLLTDQEKYEAFSRAARQSVLRYDVSEAVRRWDAILAGLNGNGKAALAQPLQQSQRGV
jgi:glycosyltransferase involved in cell wall biosynthesis